MVATAYKAKRSVVLHQRKRRMQLNECRQMRVPAHNDAQAKKRGASASRRRQKRRSPADDGSNFREALIFLKNVHAVVLLRAADHA